MDPVIYMYGCRTCNTRFFETYLFGEKPEPTLPCRSENCNGVLTRLYQTIFPPKVEKHNDESTCGRCGGKNPVWFVDSDRYNTAVNRSEIVCPACFIEAHEKATGMRTLWELRPHGGFRWIDEERVTPYINH